MLEVRTRADLETNGLSVDQIEGLYRMETVDLTGPDAQELLKAKETLSWDEVYGEVVTLHGHIECPVEMAYEYCANIYSLEEFTGTLRNAKHIGGGVYVMNEGLSPNTLIYVAINAYPDSKVVEHVCAWDQARGLWMRYYFRFYDGWETIRKVGTCYTLTNFRHPYYHRDSEAPDYVAVPRKRTDRDWVGDFWHAFPAGHGLEVQNMKRILEARFKHVPY